MLLFAHGSRSLQQFTTIVRHPDVPYKDPGCGGSADGLSKIHDVFFNPWEEGVHKIEDRKGLLVEEFVYLPALAQIKPKNANIVSVKMDSEGLLVYGPGGLLDVLENWDLKNGKQPHMFYSVPTGQNPTSGVLSYQRQQQIYEVCLRFDVLIVEDDPYWNLYYPGGVTASTRNDERTSTTGYKFLDELIPSFLEIDTDGCVIRIDTFSKSIAPGCRLGYKKNLVSKSIAFIDAFRAFWEMSSKKDIDYILAEEDNSNSGTYGQTADDVKRIVVEDR